MIFVYPAFLWALLALAIPIIVHLFNFRKTTRVFFSNNRFLKQVKEATTAKRKLKYYLVLASRLLFIFFLVIAFAQPFLPATRQLKREKNIVIYLDNSLSMSAPVRERTKAIDEGVVIIQSIAEALPADAHYKLITNDFAPFSNSFKTREELIDLLSEIKLSAVSREVNEVKEKIRGAGIIGTDVFWIADFQKSTVGKKSLFLNDSLSHWHLIPIDFQNESNVFVDTAYLENPFITAGQANALHVRLQQSGDKIIENLSIKLTIDNVQAGTAALTIPASGKAEVVFDLSSSLRGFHRAIISFADYPVNFDNEFYLALNLADKINVVEIRESRTATSIEKVFGNKQVFSCQSFHASSVNYALLSQADLVVVNGFNTLDNTLQAALQNYKSQSGLVVLIPGVSMDASSYSRILQHPVRTLEETDMAELDRPDFSNPFFDKVFEERTSQLAMPKARLKLDWGADRSAILKMRDGRPFLSRLQNNVFVFASPLERTFTNLDNNALFVPIMYKIAESARKETSHLYTTLQNDFITLHMDSLNDEQPLRLTGRQEVIPTQRRVNTTVHLELPKFSVERGFYNVMADADTLALLAINQTREESLLDQLKADEIKSYFQGNVSFFDSSDAGTFGNEIKERYLGKPLWKFALIIALLCLLAEVLLIRFLK
ncbi:MAG: BatA domain-containing protein [Flammeovirgaceae bacterium]|nr:BatA domain-containing protein [Flammeovirgaceae bacterium]